MSKKHATVAQQTQQILHDVKVMPKEQLEGLYGIEVKDDGTVFDIAYQQTFPNIATWATFSAQQDVGEDEDLMRHKGYREDEE